VRQHPRVLPPPSNDHALADLLVWPNDTREEPSIRVNVFVASLLRNAGIAAARCAGADKYRAKCLAEQFS